MLLSLVDHRTKEEQSTLTYLAMNIDDWGKGLDVDCVAYACAPKHIDKVFAWLRKEHKANNLLSITVYADDLAPCLARCVYRLTIHPVTEGHPALA